MKYQLYGLNKSKIFKWNIPNFLFIMCLGIITSGIILSQNNIFSNKKKFKKGEIKYCDKGKCCKKCSQNKLYWFLTSFGIGLSISIIITLIYLLTFSRKIKN